MNSHRNTLIGFLVLLSILPLYSHPPTPVPDGFTAEQKEEFMPHYLEVKRQYDELDERTKQFNAKYKNIPEDSPLVAEAEQQQALLNTEIADYKVYANQYETDLAAAANITLADLNNQIPKTKAQLLRTTQQLQGFQASADEWIDLAEDARRKARISARETVATLLLEKLSLNNETETQLDESSLERINSLLHDRVFMDDLYAQVLTAEKLDALKSEADVVNILKNIKGTLDISNVDLNEKESVLKAVLKGIEVVDKDPQVALLIADGEITIDSAYGWLAAKEGRDRVNQLLELSGDQLKAVTSVSNLYEREIKNRKSLMAALQK